MKASDLDFSTIPNFNRSEFPFLDTASYGKRSILEFLDARIIQALQSFRTRVGAPITPSPVSGAWVREGGSTGSQHYIGPIQKDEDGELQAKRLGVAADFFPHCDIREAFLIAMGMPEFGGIGVYFDTYLGGKPTPMMHLDLRSGPRQIWLRDGRYTYPMRGGIEMRRFFVALGSHS